MDDSDADLDDVSKVESDGGSADEDEDEDAPSLFVSVVSGHSNSKR